MACLKIMQSERCNALNSCLFHFCSLQKFHWALKLLWLTQYLHSGICVACADVVFVQNSAVNNPPEDTEYYSE